MKEVEFRAWDLKDKRMYHNVGIVGTLIILEHEQSGYEFCELELKSYDHIDNNYVLMQYTGIRDTEGTKIFDGDIVKNAFGEKYRIVWDEKRCQFIAATTIEDGSEWYQNVSRSLEVIGNIYENSTK
ncbi:YopX family protein [Bacillus wiedmannii]|uniref:YopX family protein n=1 Tax=Bacillus wiedmannii TaxID=1890302 RepID=UPI002E1DDC35|nr:YopX family protein [Bacillus wiedmannii]